ncbi:MAG: mechanosensitive ion channel family protein [Salinibacter sp.]
MNLSNISDLILGTLSQWLETFLSHLPNLAVSLLVLAAFVYLARVVRRLVRMAMDETSEYVAVNRLVGTLSSLVVWATGGFIALSILDLSGFVATLLAGVGIIGLALSFAFQGLATNFIASVVLSVRHPFTEGDRVETNGHTGTVEELTLLTTILRTPSGQKVVIPNKEVFENPLTNYSDQDTRRVDVQCGVSFNDDLQATKETALEAVKTVDGLVSDRGVDFFYEEFGGSSINFVVRFWIDASDQGAFFQARSDAVEAIKAEFDAAGLEIPYPIRTIDLWRPDGASIEDVLQN